MNLLKSTALLLSIFFATSVFADDSPKIIKVKTPIEVKQEVKTGIANQDGSYEPSIEGLQWNRWTSKNFVVLCLNDTQAQYLHQHLESVKSWTLSRWGMYDVDFSSECKVICVDDPVLYKKLFGLSESRAEVRRDETGKIKATVVFLLVNDVPSKTVPSPVSEVCFAELSQKYNTKFPLWANRGMRELNASIPQIRQRMAELQTPLASNTPMYFSKGLLEMTEEQYKKETAERQALYDRNATAFCLMIRKEFGQDNYLTLLKKCSEGAQPETALREVIKFPSYASFDSSYKRFMIDLSKECVSGSAPDQYLQVQAKKK